MPFTMSSAPQHVEVSAKKWIHDSLHLFDFEATEESLESSSFIVSPTSTFVKTGDEIQSTTTATNGTEKARPLLKCRPNGEHVDVCPVKTSSVAHAPWLVVGDLQQGLNKISAGDTVMLGRATLEVCQVVTKDSPTACPQVLGDTCCPCTGLDESDSLQCRICLMEGASAENPFVTPCKCSGSIQHVHLHCLRQWAKTRLNLPTGSVEEFVYKKPICEMCKEDFPAFVIGNGQYEPLVDELPQVEAPFMVLKSTTKGSKKDGKDRKVAYHVVSFKHNNLAKIGRGRECTIKIEEPSMSRWHATIAMKDGNFIIEDQQSKFGTLLAMRKTWTLVSGQPLSVKVGRTLLSLTLPKATGSALSSPRSSVSSEDVSKPL